MLVSLAWAMAWAGQTAPSHPPGSGPDGAPHAERRTSPALELPAVAFNHPPREYVTNHVRQWTVFVEKQMVDEDPDLAQQALERLGAMLDKAMRALPPASHSRLQALPLFLMYGEKAKRGGRDNGLEYFQRIAPEHYPNLDPRMGGSVVIYSAANYVWLSDSWALKALVHEFAHAHHLEQWPEVQPDIYDAWDHARVSGLYRDVKDDAGKELAQGYALQNHLEYFAELSCVYFVGCNYYPFNREELKTYDPVGYAMIEEMWGVKASADQTTAGH